MRIVLAALVCAMLSGASTRPAPPNEMTVQGLTQHRVIGRLGLPVGTVTEIRATVIAGSELELKQYDGSYLLRVTEVGGRAVRKPFPIELQVLGFVDVRLANNSFRLYELKTGKKAARLDSGQIADLQKDYVGKNVRLVVYETGGYSGIADHLPPDVPVWQDHSFSFSTHLVVLSERR